MINTDKLIRKATDQMINLSDMILGVEDGKKPPKKFQDMTMQEYYDIITIYTLIYRESCENPNHKTFKKAWSLVEKLDSTTRDDYLDKTVYSILEKYFA